MRWFPFLIALAGCGGSSSDPDFPPGTLDAEYTDCSEASDCVAVELGCCDECNGGYAVAVRSDRADDVRDAFSEQCPNDQACTEMGCAAWVIDCVEQTCQMERGSFKR